MRTFRALVVTGAVLASSLLVAVPNASAAGPSITVTPSTGLVDGQTVTVAGTGFTVPPSLFLLIGECANVASPGYNDCDATKVSTFLLGTNDFVETYKVARFITTVSQGTIDCAVPNACLLGAQEFNLQFFVNQDAFAPIAFAPPPPTNFRILNARLIGHVSPGQPVELRVRAVNDGQTPANWSISQSKDVGLIAVSASCPGGTAQAAGLCVYTPAERGVGQPATAVFTVEAAAGFAGTASATVCATDLDSQGSTPASNTCEVVTTTVG